MYFARSYNNTPKLLLRTGRQMARAIFRGDTDAAWRWSLIFERQLDIALKLAEIDPDDNRLRRFRPALAAMRRMVLVRETPRAASNAESPVHDQKMQQAREPEPQMNRNASSAPHATGDVTA